MANVGATISIGDFVTAIKDAMEAITSNDRISVVDKITFQNVANPNYQIELSSITPISPNTSINYSVLEYKLHVIVGVYKDQYANKEQRFVQSVSAMSLMSDLINGMTTLAADATARFTNQIFIKTDMPVYDDNTGLSVCTAHFKTYFGYQANG